MTTKPTWRQHTVPRFYLNRFATNEQIHTLDLHELKTFRQNISNATVGRDFYESSTFQSNAIEKHLAERESEFSKRLDEISGVAATARISALCPNRYFSPLLKQQWARLFLNLHFRTISHRKQTYNRLTTPNAKAEIAETVRQSLGPYHEQELAGPFDPVEMMGITVDEFHSEWLVKPTTSEPLINLWSTWEWRIWEVAGPNKLYISDNPVALTFNGRANGLANGEPHAFLPVSDNLIVAMIADSSLLLEYPDFAAIPSEFSDTFNKLQVANAERFVYSADGNFELAFRLANDVPRIRDGYLEMRRDVVSRGMQVVLI